MGGKTSTTTQSVQIPPEVLARYNAVNKRAEQVATNPFEQYSTNVADFVAQINPQQQAGINAVNQAAGSYQPFFQGAAGATVAGMGAANPGELDVSKYMNPFQQQVIDATMRQMRQENELAQSGALGTAAQSGAFGGDRAGIAAANLANQQGLAMGSTLAGLNAQNYGQALATAQQQQGVELGADQANLARLMAGGQQLAGLGTAYQGAGLQGAEAQLNAGTLEQQTEQAGLGALYNQFQQEKAYPFQVAQFLANVAMGTGALSGSTTTTTQPGSFWSDRRLKHDIQRIGKTDDGLPIYKFKYKGDPEEQTHIGFMADEVEKKSPDAVGVADNGYKYVDYDRAARATGGGVAGPYGASVGSQPGAEGYVPQAFLPVGELMVADPSIMQQARASLAQQLANVAGLGESVQSLDKAYQYGRDKWNALKRDDTGYAHGGLVDDDEKRGLAPGYLRDKEETNPVKDTTYLSDTLKDQEVHKPQLLQPGAPPAQGPSGAAQLGGLLGGAGAFMKGLSLLGLSDRRAKHDIRRIGKTDNGMPIYSFKYKGDDRMQTHIGFMADEVEQHHPDAVATGPDGMKRVDYSKADKFYRGGIVGRPAFATDGGVRDDRTEGEKIADAMAGARYLVTDRIPRAIGAVGAPIVGAGQGLAGLAAGALNYPEASQYLLDAAKGSFARGIENDIMANRPRPETVRAEDVGPTDEQAAARQGFIDARNADLAKNMDLVPPTMNGLVPTEYGRMLSTPSYLVAPSAPVKIGAGVVPDDMPIYQNPVIENRDPNVPVGVDDVPFAVSRNAISIPTYSAADDFDIPWTGANNLREVYDRFKNRPATDNKRVLDAALAYSKTQKVPIDELLPPESAFAKPQVETAFSADDAPIPVPAGVIPAGTTKTTVGNPEFALAFEERNGFPVSEAPPPLVAREYENWLDARTGALTLGRGIKPMMITPSGVDLRLPAGGAPTAAPAPEKTGVVAPAVKTPVPTGVAAQPAAAGPKEDWATFSARIGARESGNNYDALYNQSQKDGKRFAGVKPTEMTLNQILDFTKPSGAYGQWVADVRPDKEYGVATPVGKYQMVGDLIRTAMKEMGLTGDEVFTPELQDAMAKHVYDKYGAKPWALPGEATGVAGGRSNARFNANEPFFGYGTDKPWDERTTIGKMFYNPDGSVNRNAMLSLLSGVGSMLASPSQWFLPSLGLGLQGFAGTYAGLEKQAADIGLTKAQERRERVAADKERIYEGAGGVMFINFGDGRPPVQLWDYLRNPGAYTTGDATLDAQIKREAEAAAAEYTGGSGVFSDPGVQSYLSRERANAEMNPNAARTQSDAIESATNAAAAVARSSIPSILTQADAVSKLTSPDAVVRSGAMGPLKQTVAVYVNELSKTINQLTNGAANLPVIQDATGEAAGSDAELILKYAVQNGMINATGYNDLLEIMKTQPNAALTEAANSKLMAGLLVSGRVDMRRADFMRDYKAQPSNNLRTVIDADQAFHDLYGDQILAEKAALTELIHYGSVPMPDEWKSILGDYSTPMEFLMTPGIPAAAKDEFILKLLPQIGVNPRVIEALNGPGGLYIGHYFGG